MPDFNIPERLEGRDIYLVPFIRNSISERYLGWLNDPEVNKFSRRRFVKSGREDAERFLDGLAETEAVLAIHMKGDKQHMGNIQLGPVDFYESRAEIRILVGERGRWGTGIGTQAIYLVTKYLVQELGLHRVEANSCNPAFIRCVEKLGWKDEGCLRERFPVEGERLDFHWLGLLKSEFQVLPEYEY
ncbi:MAG: GNAT family protein [Verrucomicrobiota bacterium]